MTYLDFEKPVAVLDAEIERIKATVPPEKLEAALTPIKKALDSTLAEVSGHLTSWQRVQLARHPFRPYTHDYVMRFCTDFLELHGDRRFADDDAVIGGFARIDGRPVMIMGTRKGRNTKENVVRNFGCPHPEGYRKAHRLMELADKAGVPLITFIDTPGAFPGVASEERHIGEAIAVNLQDMFDLEIPVVCVVIGEGGSGGALAVGVGNSVLIMENAYYSVITPEGCAAILWKDRAFSPNAAEALKLTSHDLLKLGLVDGIIPEPAGGAHRDYDKAASAVHDAIVRELKRFEGMSAAELKNQRYERFRKVHFFTETVQKPVSGTEVPASGKDCPEK